MTKKLKAGEFTGLATFYSENRPNYSNSVLSSLLGLFEHKISNLKVIDVGAGTGIWTRMIYDKGVKSLKAIEPNLDMLTQGKKDSLNKKINWFQGNAEHIHEDDSSVDWITMASSFHWADFDKAVKEFYRVLKPQGIFTALWNPRLIEVNPLLVEIEEFLSSLKPDIKRVSSGRSGITETLYQKLWESKYFEDVIYIEGRHDIEMTTERYIGAWKSVNDLRVQLGEQSFKKFLEFIEKKISNEEIIKATYLTRSWSARSSKSWKK